MIPLDLWNSEEMRKRRENAVAKALKEDPKVDLDGVTGSRRFYRVKDQYTVEVYTDPDGQVFVSCACAAGSPPIDDNTGLPSREAVCCYHAASVLIFIAETEKEDESE